MRNLLRTLGLCCLPFLLLLALACSPQKTGTAPTVTEETDYLGNAACQPCHAAEFASHQKTRHSATMREATRAALGELAPTPGTGTNEPPLTEEAGRFQVDSLALQLVLGSGKTGMTFLALFADSCTEIRKSYFPHEKRWLITPGQEKIDESQVGRIFMGEEAQRCLGCHAVTLPSHSFQVEKRFFGVGCESCHGPGKAHVAAMQKGGKPTSLAIEALKGASGEKLNEVCGACHRTLEAAQNLSPELQKSTNRFQPYGLALSRCFQESKGKLTCVTCHNPHEDAGTDPKPYERACLSCHSAPKKTCPVNPKTACVGCHMPTRPVFSTGDVPMKMADHFIKIVGKGTTPPPR